MTFTLTRFKAAAARSLLKSGLLCFGTGAMAQSADIDRELPPVDELLKGTAAAEAMHLEMAPQSAYQVSLRQFDTPVRDQRKTGLCTAYATIAAIENLINQKKGPGMDVPDFSELAFWTQYWDYSVDASTKTAAAQFLVDESQLPFAKNLWDLEEKAIPGLRQYKVNPKYGVARIASKEAFTRQQDVLKHIDKGFPVIIGAEVNDSFFSNHARKTGRITTQAPKTGGGHAMLIVGYRIDPEAEGGGHYIMKNSWGADWGDGGYGYLPFNYCGDRPGQHWCGFISVMDVNHYTNLKISSDLTKLAETPLQLNKSGFKLDVSLGAPAAKFASIREVAFKALVDKIHTVDLTDPEQKTADRLAPKEWIEVVVKRPENEANFDFRATLPTGLGDVLSVTAELRHFSGQRQGISKDFNCPIETDTDTDNPDILEFSRRSCDVEVARRMRPKYFAASPWSPLWFECDDYYQSRVPSNTGCYDDLPLGGNRE